MDEVTAMKAEYNIAAMKSRGHPLRKKVAKGEIKLIDPYSMPDSELNKKLALLTPEERELFLTVRKRKYSTIRQ